MNHNNTPALNSGDRIRLIAGSGFFDAGDDGVIQSFDTHEAEVLFDGGATGLIPLSLLERDTGDFRLTHPDGRLSVISYPSENDATDAAERFGYTSFRVVRVVEVASYTMSTIPQPASFTPATR